MYKQIRHINIQVSDGIHHLFFLYDATYDHQTSTFRLFGITLNNLFVSWRLVDVSKFVWRYLWPENVVTIILFVTSSWSIPLPKQKSTFTPLVSSIHIQWWFWLFWMVATNNCDHSICFFCACGDSGSNSAIKVNLIVILDLHFRFGGNLKLHLQF